MRVQPRRYDPPMAARAARASGTRAPRPAAATDPAEERATAAYRQLYRQADPGERAQLLAAVTDTGAPDPLDENLWGPAPTRAQDAAAQLTLLERRFADRRALADRSLTPTQVAATLGISAQAVTDLLERGELVGLKTGRRWLIPAWELDPDHAGGVVPGLAQLARAFPGGVVSLTRWVSRPSPDLDGRTPQQALAEGDVEAVVALAHELTSVGW